MGNSIRYYEDSLERACESDNIESVQKYISKLEANKKINIHKVLQRCFIISCIHGSLKTLIWLTSIGINKIDDKTLNYILQKNYFDIFLILVNKDIIKVDKKLFEKSCTYNKDITKWIYTVNHEIDIQNNTAFLNACSRQRLDILTFFLDNDFDLENNDDYIFKNVCKMKRKKVIDFLCKECPRYDFFQNDRQFQPIIKDKVSYLIETKQWYDLIIFLDIKLIDNYKSRECIISFEDTNFVTNCNHHYEITSLFDWYLKKNLCPICSSKIDFSDSSIDKKFVDYIYENSI